MTQKVEKSENILKNIMAHCKKTEVSDISEREKIHKLEYLLPTGHFSASNTSTWKLIWFHHKIYVCFLRIDTSHVTPPTQRLLWGPLVSLCIPLVKAPRVQLLHHTDDRPHRDSATIPLTRQLDFQKWDHAYFLHPFECIGIFTRTKDR